MPQGLTDLELFRLFNIQLPSGKWLWHEKNRQTRSQERQRELDGLTSRSLNGQDDILPGVSKELPGKERAYDLMLWAGLSRWLGDETPNFWEVSEMRSRETSCDYTHTCDLCGEVVELEDLTFFRSQPAHRSCRDGKQGREVEQWARQELADALHISHGDLQLIPAR